VRSRQCQRKRTLKSTRDIIGSASLFAVVVFSALAQPSDEDVRGSIKVEVTGSRIARADAQSALPVQVLTREDILRSGATTTSDVLGKVSGNMLGFNDQLAIGDLVRPGLASANLRGIGSGSTLVLLNGRRVANYAFDGGTVDVNQIPLSAIDRIEILKDGASAIYGTDAIAGVVNFVLRKDFRGFEATGYGGWTEHGGADTHQAVLTAGYGKLAADRFNVFATVSHQKDDALRALDRSFSRTGYIPGEGVNQLSGTSFPSNIQVRPGVLVNPAFATGCKPPASIPVNIAGFLSRAPFCAYDFPSAIDIIPPAERTGAVGRATLQVNADNQLFAEASYAYNRFIFRNSPTAALQAVGAISQPVLYPAGGLYYPTEFAAANGIAGDLNLRFRTVQLGPQTNGTDTRALRVAAGAEGTLSSWSYSTALVYSENRQSDRFMSGYVSQARFIPALATGLINPFGASGPEGDALLASTQIVGDSHHGKGTTLAIDVKASKEVCEMPAGSLAIALGGEARREKLDNIYSAVWSSADILGLSATQQSAGGSRTAAALFVEADVPFARGFEAQVAARYDHYGDFGSTTNPKIALRWQPARTLLLRTSWGTGFRAPTLYDLFTPLSLRPIFAASLVDPIRCPVTGLPMDCPGAFGGAFESASGGNPNLQPEKSEQFNAGVVWEPLFGLSLNVDYWKINKRNVIGALDTGVVFTNFDRYAPTNIIRGPAEPNFPALPGPIETVLLTEQNLGDLRTSGIDIAANWRSRSTSIGIFGFGLDGTYVLSWDEQLDGIRYTSALGRKGSGIAGPVPRWKHHATLNWEYGQWGATIGQTYQLGYLDANVDRAGAPLPVPPRRVGSYDVWDLQGRYSGFPNATIALGVKNLMDRVPPFSNQAFTRQVGYDPAYADPRGRTYYARLTLVFK
jgi:iron complex outermembrane recepter protein